MFKSTGNIKYQNERFFVSVDEELSKYYISQIPTKLNRQKYAPHITIAKITKSQLSKLCLSDFYKKYFPKSNSNDDVLIGKLILFEYDHFVFNNETYYWLNVYSKELTEFIERFDLELIGDIWMPPDGTKCFHITLGNLKGNNGSAII